MIQTNQDSRCNGAATTIRVSIRMVDEAGKRHGTCSAGRGCPCQGSHRAELRTGHSPHKGEVSCLMEGELTTLGRTNLTDYGIIEIPPRTT